MSMSGWEKEHQRQIRLDLISWILSRVLNFIGFIGWIYLLFIGEFLLSFVFLIIFAISAIILTMIISPIILWIYNFIDPL